MDHVNKHYPLNDAWILGRVEYRRRRDGDIWIHMADGDTEDWRPICTPIGVIGWKMIGDDESITLRVRLQHPIADLTEVSIPRSALADRGAVLARLYAHGLRTVGQRGEDFVIEMLKAVSPAPEVAAG